MALSEKAKEKLNDIAEIVAKATGAFEELKTVLTEAELNIANEHMSVINAAAEEKPATSKAVDELEAEVKTAYEALQRMRESHIKENDSDIQPEEDEAVNDDNPDIQPEEEDETENDVNSENGEEGIENIIYCGPTLKKYGLTKGAAFVGKKSDTLKFLKDAINDIPEVESMLVTSGELAEKLKALKAKNNAFYIKYKEIERKSREE